MSDNAQFPVVIVAGPTGSGKSAMALALARKFSGTVINADSMQVYRDLRILTARPSDEDEARAPHRLYGVLDAAEQCSAARWCEMADAAVKEARAAGRLPIFCGGTGLYLKALTEGLSPMPDIPEAMRSDLRRRYSDVDGADLHQALATADPQSAVSISPTDRQRMLRALEVWEATGRSLQDWQALPLEPVLPNADFHTILLLPPRQPLYDSCDDRLQRMIVAGALDEVRALKALELDPELPAMKALGVDALMRHLDGLQDLDTALAAAQQATRRYVKRQFTWFTRQIIANLTIEEKYSEKFEDRIFSFILKKGLTCQT
jgi:tRNA dimethylallyltransferase